MTEQSKIPLPGHVSKDKSLFERADGMFGLGALNAAPVPDQLAEPTNRRPSSAPAKPQAEVRRTPAESVETSVALTAPQEPVSVRTPAEADNRIEFTGVPQRVDRERLRSQGFIVPGGEVTALFEEFRIIKRQILLAARDALDTVGGPAAQRVLVCSPLPGEGKTFCAANLALAIAAEKDVEVVLVDADFAKRRSSRCSGSQAERA